jgi:transcriptional regulator with XRE-family HTH domain
MAGLPVSVRRSIEKLGADLSAARKRRRLTMDVVAERAFVSRKTLGRVERGDPGVSIGIYATVLFVLGLSAGLDHLADVTNDEVGLALETLPTRVRSKG